MKGVCIGIALIAALAAQAPPPVPTVRLHHLHYQVPSISAAMADVVSTIGGTRVILQGVGIGVRLGDFYLLFNDRGPADPPAAAAGPPAGGRRPAVDAVRDAAILLDAHGVVVSRADNERAIVRGIEGEQMLDHVAFAAANVETVVQQLRSRGVVANRRTDESAFFTIQDTTIEITRDTDLPDVLWCPMHPEVRAAAPGRCPICSMDLVPIPPPRIGSYSVDVTQTPSAGGHGTRALTLLIRDPESGEPVTSLTPLHERPLHLFIISRDLQYFAHEHPAPARAGTFDLNVDLPEGAYMLVADFLPSGGSPQLVHRAIVTPGARVSPFRADQALREDLTEKVVDGLRVRLAVANPPRSTQAVLRFRFSDAATSAPVSDLQPYLGASGHLLIVNGDLTQAVHAHPEGLTSGPDINFGTEFPVAGLYKVWLQVQRAGKVFTAPFVVRVGS